MFVAEISKLDIGDLPTLLYAVTLTSYVPFCTFRMSFVAFKSEYTFVGKESGGLPEIDTSYPRITPLASEGFKSCSKADLFNL